MGPGRKARFEALGQAVPDRAVRGIVEQALVLARARLQVEQLAPVRLAVGTESVAVMPPFSTGGASLSIQSAPRCAQSHSAWWSPSVASRDSPIMKSTVS